MKENPKVKRYARLWVCVPPDATAHKRRKIQNSLLASAKHKLLCYDAHEDGYFDVAAVGSVKKVLKYLKRKGLKNFIVDVEDEKSARAVYKTGCEPCLEIHGLAELYQTLSREEAATAVHS